MRGPTASPSSSASTITKLVTDYGAVPGFDNDVGPAVAAAIAAGLEQLAPYAAVGVQSVIVIIPQGIWRWRTPVGAGVGPGPSQQYPSITIKGSGEGTRIFVDAGQDAALLEGNSNLGRLVFMDMSFFSYTIYWTARNQTETLPSRADNSGFDCQRIAKLNAQSNELINVTTWGVGSSKANWYVAGRVVVDRVLSHGAYCQTEASIYLAGTITANVRDSNWQDIGSNDGVTYSAGSASPWIVVDLGGGNEAQSGSIVIERCWFDEGSSGFVGIYGNNGRIEHVVIRDCTGLTGITGGIQAWGCGRLEVLNLTVRARPNTGPIIATGYLYGDVDEVIVRGLRWDNDIGTPATPVFHFKGTGNVIVEDCDGIAPANIQLGFATGDVGNPQAVRGTWITRRGQRARLRKATEAMEKGALVKAVDADSVALMGTSDGAEKAQGITLWEASVNQIVAVVEEYGQEVEGVTDGSGTIGALACAMPSTTASGRLKQSTAIGVGRSNAAVAATAGNMVPLHWMGHVHE